MGEIMKRLLVEKVEIREVQHDFPEIHNFEYKTVPLNGPPIEETYEVEQVPLRQFSRRDGTKLLIGWSKQVIDAIGIPMMAIEDMSNQLSKEIWTTSRLTSQLNTSKKEANRWYEEFNTERERADHLYDEKFRIIGEAQKRIKFWRGCFYLSCGLGMLTICFVLKWGII